MNSAVDLARHEEEAAGSNANPPRLLTRKVLEGVNSFHSSSVISQIIDLGDLAGQSTGSAGGDFAWLFMERFLDSRMRLPDTPMPSEFLDRLNSKSGVPFQDAILEAILAVETQMRFVMKDLDPVRFARCLSDGSNHATFVWAANSPELSRLVARVALSGLTELLPRSYQFQTERNKSFASQLARLESRAMRNVRSLTTAVLEAAARKRGIATEVLESPYMRVGEGFRQKTLHSTISTEEPFAAIALARHKRKTCRRLAELGLPVPRQISVRNIAGAIRASETIGYPVVVKPIKGNKSDGVTVNLTAPHEVVAAFERAAKRGRVLVEAQIPGYVHRLVVVGSQLVAAFKWKLPEITGDGKSSVTELIQELNCNPLRDGIRLNKVKLDGELRRTIRRAGYQPQDILEAGKVLLLSSKANFSCGALPIDVAKIAHPENIEMAVQATRAIGLNVAGIDFICEDISRSYKLAGGAILEVNARPGVSPPAPAHDTRRDVAGKIIDYACPEPALTTIPKIVIIGDRGTNVVSRLLSAILSVNGQFVGVLDREGRASINGDPVVNDATNQQEAMRTVLRDPRVEALVNLTSFHSIDKRGLLVESCGIAAVLEPRSSDAETVQRGLGAIAKHTPSYFVIGDRDYQALEALRDTSTARLILIGTDVNEALGRHVEAGGKALVCTSDDSGDHITWLSSDQSSTSVSLQASTASMTKRVMRLQQIGFGAAIAWQMGLPREALDQAISEIQV